MPEKIKEKSQYKIYIDSSKTKEKDVILLKIENRKEVVMARKTGDIDIVGSIKSLIEEKKLNLSEIDFFEANPGPGSFTGLKMGITVSNILNLALKTKNLKKMQKPKYGAEPNIQLRKN